MYTATFVVTPPDNVFTGGWIEADQIDNFVKGAAVSYSVDKVETVSDYTMAQKFTISGPQETLVNDAITAIQDNIPNTTIEQITVEAVTEAAADIGSGAQSIASTVGKTVANAVTPIVSSLTPVLIIVGIVGIAYIAMIYSQTKGK